MTTFTTKDPKDPNAELDYKFDWKPKTNLSGNSDWLDTTETISSFTITSSTGITVDSSELADDNTSVIVWLSGGTGGSSYTVACKIVTSASRTDERTLTVNVEDR